MDGFRADYLDVTDTPNFDKLANNGIRTEGLKPVFISKTFPNHYSIATGMYVENHGLIANSFFASDLDKYYTMSDRETVENGQGFTGLARSLTKRIHRQALRCDTILIRA